MTSKVANVFVHLSLVVGLIGSCIAENAEKAPGADNSAGARPSIFQTERPSQGVAASTSSRRAQVSEARFRGASSQELGGMELTLQAYRSAIENLSLPQVRQVWPALDHHREAALKETFEYLRSMSATLKLGMECAAPPVTGESAWVECRETLSYTDAKGKTKDVKPAHVSILLRRQSSNWIVETMKQRD
jgi:hypothetical protein